MKDGQGLLGQTTPEMVRPVESLTPRLTARQTHALRLAVAEGYYGIPRPINLQTLASRMGISTASMSELLRRAEREIIVSYARSLSHSPLPTPGPTTDA